MYKTSQRAATTYSLGIQDHDQSQEEGQERVSLQ